MINEFVNITTTTIKRLHYCVSNNIIHKLYIIKELSSLTTTHLMFIMIPELD